LPASGQAETERGSRNSSHADEDKGSNSIPEVRFAPAILSFLSSVWGDYRIIALDDNYRYAECDNRGDRLHHGGSEDFNGSVSRKGAVGWQKGTYQD
jgi:hypothetical protein